MAVDKDSIPSTDLSRWRLKVDDGRQTWHYLEQEELKMWPQTNADKYFLGVPYDKKTFPKPKTALEAAKNAFEFLKDLQTEDGHWACEYGGPLFLIPGLCIALYTTGSKLPEPYRKELIRYLCNFANEDGGWGLHIEHHSTTYGTVMNYVSLRILGLEPDHPVMVKARSLIHERGGATLVPSWGKLLLACLNVYSWEGINPIPPELWCLPTWSPFHPGHMWTHSRNVYLPMCYLFGVRFTCKEDPFIMSLREEIYCEDFSQIDWYSARNAVHEIDVYVPHSKPMQLINVVLGWYENIIPYMPFLRDMGLKEALNQLHMEDENTKYLNLGPVNQVMNMMCSFHADGADSHSYKSHVERFYDFLYMGNDGMMMNGTNGVQLWDTAFIVQAAMEAKIADEPGNKEALIKAHQFLDSCQIKENSKYFGKDYRHISKGAWPFSTRDQSYTVSDCTAEGLKAVLYLQSLGFTEKLISDERIFDAVNVLLSILNSNGGSASYELVRGGSHYELFNVAEVFGDIMIEYCYPECTTAVLLGLTTFNKFYPDHRTEEIKKAQQNAVKFIKSIQWEDGSWYGSWGVCFTYATFFAIESLTTFGEFYDNSSSVKRACDYLVTKQQNDGGWGETFKSCEQKVYTQAKTSQVVNTAWALLALMAARYPNLDIIERGIKVLMERQLPSGEWRQELIEGVFNKNCMISYPNYKLYFTLWALGRFANNYGNPTLFD